jgi:hypothetical protein
MKELMQQYVPPDKDLPQQALENKNISLSPGAGSQVQITTTTITSPRIR